VPYDVVFGLDDAERLAFLAIFGDFEGFSFDWKTMRWKSD
jgi:hypothetical protein